MLNLKAIFVVSCLVVVVVATDEELTGSEVVLTGQTKKDAEHQLEQAFFIVANEGGPAYTAKDYQKVTKEGNTYKYQVTLYNLKMGEKDCRASLAGRELTVNCPNEPTFNETL